VEASWVKVAQPEQLRGEAIRHEVGDETAHVIMLQADKRNEQDRHTVKMGHHDV
jgi:hypothetical protein